MSARQFLCVLCIAAAFLVRTSTLHAQTIVYVNAAAPIEGDGTTWAAAHKYLGAALANAAAKADAGQAVQVWIAAGTYLPDQSVSTPDGGVDGYATFTLHNSVSLFGGFTGSEVSLDQADPAAHDTVLRGFTTSGPSYGTRHVITGAGVNSSVLIDGLSITNPFIPLGGNRVARLTQSSPTFRRCIIRDTETLGGNHGAAVSCTGGRPVFEDCQFLRNEARANGRGGAIYAPDTDIVLRRCAFNGNKADGGGGALYGAGPGAVIEDCTFNSNSGWRDGYGGALHLGPGVTVRRCVFVNNSAYYGGGAVYGGGRIQDCIFVNNSSSWENTGAAFTSELAGCIFIKSSLFLRDGSVLNCTLLGSDVQIHYWSTGARIANSILPAPPRVQPPGLIPTVTNCYLQSITPLYSGNGNIGGSPFMSPRFADPDGPDNIPATLDDDLRLLPGSPCIDAGDNSAVPPGTLSDADGMPRFFDDPGMPDAGSGTAPVVDMGPYEFQGTSCLADFNGDGFADGSDHDLFISLFNPADPAADLNRDGFTDGIDYDLFQNAFEAGC